MTNNNDKHIAEQIANSFNDNDKKIVRDEVDNFKEEKKLTISEPTSFKYPDSIVDFIEEQTPEELERQLLQTCATNWFDPSDSAELD